jgi:hypothetical protein
MTNKVRGRPKLPEGEKLVPTGVRLPQWMIDACRGDDNLSATIRKALTNYFQSQGIDTV